MSGNPFAEPGDDDRTIIQPVPDRRPSGTSGPVPGLSGGPEAAGPGPHGLFGEGVPPPAAAGSGGWGATRDEPDATQASQVSPTGTGFGDVASVGPSPILAAAGPLLSLLARLRNVLSVPDPGALRDRTVEEIRRFEQTLRQQNLPMELIRTSHYALCASLDDVVRNTPWGSRGPWADTSLVAAFHGEVRSGERFFDVLVQISSNQGKFLPVIELM